MIPEMNRRSRIMSRQLALKCIGAFKQCYPWRQVKIADDCNATYIISEDADDDNVLFNFSVDFCHGHMNGYECKRNPVNCITSIGYIYGYDAGYAAKALGEMQITVPI